MSTQEVRRDERTVAVENVSYRWASSFVSIALLIDVMCRGLFFDEAAWELLALACVPGFVCLFYQARQKTLVLSWKSMLLLVFAMILAAATSVILTLTRGR